MGEMTQSHKVRIFQGLENVFIEIDHIMTTVQAPLSELPEELQRWLTERLKSHARLHFETAQELVDWCDSRDLLGEDMSGNRSVRHSTPIQIYQAIRQMVLELDCPDVLREMDVMQRQLRELREENALLQTTVAVLSGQLRAAREDETSSMN